MPYRETGYDLVREGAFNDLVFKGGDVLALARQSNGNIIVGGSFKRVNSQIRTGVALFNSAGELQNFIKLGLKVSTGGITSVRVNKIAILSNNMIIIAGSFDQVTSAGITYNLNGIALLEESGTLNTSFTGPLKPGSKVNDVVEISSNLYVGGNFSLSSTVFVFKNLVRLNSIGTLDPSFNPAPNNTVNALLYHIPSESLVLGGLFTSVGGQTRNYLASYSTLNWTLNAGFNPNPDGAVYALKDVASTVFFGGSFSNIASTYQKALAQVWPNDGNIVSAFYPVIDSATVNKIEFLTNAVLAGGVSAMISVTRISALVLPK
jgi:hypothetical protein